jgi:hypothetical protein
VELARCVDGHACDCGDGGGDCALEKVNCCLSNLREIFTCCSSGLKAIVKQLGKRNGWPGVSLAWC